jgi:hypothetical protein
MATTRVIDIAIAIAKRDWQRERGSEERGGDGKRWGGSRDKKQTVVERRGGGEG